MYETLNRDPGVAVIGYGRWGRQCHSYLIDTTPGLRLAGIVSSDPTKRERAAAERHCHVFNSPAEAFASPDVDVIVLATPNDTHKPLAIQALDAGKHVVTDKVMCLNLNEFMLMRNAADRNNRLLTVFQNRRLDGDYLTVRKLIEDNRLGDVRWIEMAWQGFGMMSGWRGSTARGGGKLYDLGPHLIDQVLQLIPSPVTDVYYRSCHDFTGYDVPSEDFLILTFADGRNAVIDLSSMAAIRKPRFYIRGTEGAFVKYGLDPQEAAQARGNIDDAHEDPALFGTLKTRDSETRIPTLKGRWRSYYENLRDALLGKCSPLVRLSEQERQIRVLDAAQLSALTHQAVILPQF